MGYTATNKAHGCNISHPNISLIRITLASTMSSAGRYEAIAPWRWPYQLFYTLPHRGKR